MLSSIDHYYPQKHSMHYLEQLAVPFNETLSRRKVHFTRFANLSIYIKEMLLFLKNYFWIKEKLTNAYPYPLNLFKCSNIKDKKGLIILILFYI